ncbi:MAG: DUF1697 domain-containing protein [Aquamicrobium sp.]|uniref:DUF1697 domain-containing protein n=1 Tax=Aquamicrobium sp. TaxID=1872579 RepID=UPI00349E8E07|nr:DUF1697 domain-containing protein [Aquamicrobium sp.]
MSDGTAYIVLFRGVGGKTQIPVAPLREALTAAGFDNVATYINSGNAVLKSALSRGEVASRVAEVCARDFAFDKDVHVATRVEWRALIATNPFPEAVETPTFLHAALLAGAPEPARVEALRALAAGGEGIAIVGTVAYLHTPHGFGTSKLAAKFDKGIGVANTARNWNTVLKLDELAAAADV